MQRQYWKRQLAGAPLLLELPTDKARPAEPSGHGSHVRVMLPAGVVASLRTLAAGCGVTMFVALTAAWQACPFATAGSAASCSAGVSCRSVLSFP